MSTAERIIVPGQRPPGRFEREKSRPFAVLGWISSPVRRVPMVDWITLLLLGVMLATVGWAVQLAKWGDLPSIIPTLLMGWLAAFIASRTRAPIALKLILATVIGFAIIMWQGSIPADASNVADRARDAWDRFWAWIAIAQEGGISNDSVPFALMFMAASWVTGYTVTALTFRFRNPWAPVVLLSVGLLNNLSFRPGLYEHTFFIFTLASVALFAHLTAVRRTDRWAALGVNHPSSLHWQSMRDGLLFGTIVVLIAAVLPLWEPRSNYLDRVWDTLKSPIVALEDPATRLLSGVKAQPGHQGLDFPKSALAFQGPIHLTPEPLMWVTSRYSIMLPGRVYEHYTSAGWITERQMTIEVEAGTELDEPPADLDREWVEQFVQPLVETDLVVPAGGIFSVDRDAEVQYLPGAQHSIPLTGAVGPLAGLPPDVRDLAFQLRFALRDLATANTRDPDITLSNQPLVSKADVQAELERILPEDLVATVVTNESGLAQGVVLERQGPMEQVGVSMTREARPDTLYRVTTYVSVADDAALAAAGEDYPGWVMDRYLQLPPSLPSEVRELANRIVRDAGARTPYEKMRAVQAFLQSQEYSQEIKGPAANTDGVYYMLFQTQNEPCASVDPDCDVSKIKAYSQYFGSAGAVLLRAVGVPTRMIVGWGAGEYVPQVGKFLIRDDDRHGWTQVYFPEYGWVDVEMTPGTAEPDRGTQYSVEPARGAGGPGAVSSAEEDIDFLTAQDIADAEAAARLALESFARQQQQQANAASSNSIPWTLIIVLASIAGGIAVLYGAWTLLHRGMTPGQRAYTKMVRTGRLLGIKRSAWQTPAEYAAEIAAAAPGIAGPAELIALQYERERYAKTDADGPAENMDRHWRKVFFGLLSYRVRSIGGRQAELRDRRGTA